MPRQGQSVESCIIGQWLKNKGDAVEEGDVLFTYETDKTSFEEAAKVSGILLEVFFEEGDDVPCLQNVCVIGEAGENVDAFRPTGTETPAVAAPVAASVGTTAPGRPDSPAETVTTDHPDFINISPRAKALINRTGADAALAVPSGANNRVMEADIQKVLDSGRFRRDELRSSAATVSANIPTANDYEDIKLSPVRKFIAKAMHASLAEAAQLTLNSSFNAADILDFRKKLKGLNLDIPNITVTDIIVYACSRLLPKHKSINAHFMGETMRVFNSAHIGVACDTPRGLLVPTIFNANYLSLTELSVTAKTLFEKCKQGTAEPDVLKGGTFTVSNLGGMGVESFTPVLNPPQTGILGVCSIVERTKDGAAYPAMGLSLTFDHRALDGADAARFLKDLVVYLENFSIYAALEV
jgi:pyruvate dehydrogenase E2 component (dihydrolipoamide acetyltransferase)